MKFTCTVKFYIYNYMWDYKINVCIYYTFTLCGHVDFNKSVIIMLQVLLCAVG